MEISRRRQIVSILFPRIFLPEFERKHSGIIWAFDLGAISIAHEHAYAASVEQCQLKFIVYQVDRCT